MEELCDTTVDMAEYEIPAGRLAVTRRRKYDSRMQCRVTILAPTNRRLTIVFRDLGIEWEAHCDDDYLQLFDGATMMAPLVKGIKKRLCGHREPAASFTTTGNSLTVFFQSDVHKQDNGFDLVFTAFHRAAVCLEGELHCDNGRCIAESLECNNFDNCGDNSDECKVDTEVLIAIILSVFLLTVVGVGVITIYKKRKQKTSLGQHDWYPRIMSENKTNKKNKSEFYLHPVQRSKLPIREYMDVWTTTRGMNCQEVVLPERQSSCTCASTENYKRASI